MVRREPAALWLAGGHRLLPPPAAVWPAREIRRAARSSSGHQGWTNVRRSFRLFPNFQSGLSHRQGHHVMATCRQADVAQRCGQLRSLHLSRAVDRPKGTAEGKFPGADRYGPGTDLSAPDPAALTADDPG